ncbi:hypothetical protein H5U35_04285, partial [Candidatus Aerophobetes bacterium]|nr:hypothetical protein [Candidatus Aerophobetes bacterium]
KYTPGKSSYTLIKGWMGTYRLEGNPELIKFSYDAGLGAKNSQGFGMYEVVNLFKENPFLGKKSFSCHPRESRNPKPKEGKNP